MSFHHFTPFEANQQLASDEVATILEFGVPKNWQKNMVLQGFEPMIHTPTEIVEFCERHEFTEGQVDNTKGASPKHAGKHATSAKSHVKPSAEVQNKRKHSSVEKFCDLHQKAGHSTAECKVVQAQIQKMRATWEAVKTSPQARKNWKSSYNNGNKNANTKPSNNNNSNSNSNFKKESVMALIKESLKELSIKKRKTEESNVQEEFGDFNVDDLANFTLSDSEESEPKE
jgi:hypothetical protein